MALRSRWDIVPRDGDFFGEESRVVRIGEVMIDNCSCTKPVAGGRVCDALAS